MLIAAADSGIDYGSLKTAATLVFFAIFVFILLRLVFARRGKYDRAAQIPLDDDHDNPNRRESQT